jgi:Zn-dependent peptidase ImmA (M78 family)/transcriptional regulator with XRE-family HTH domain
LRSPSSAVQLKGAAFNPSRLDLARRRRGYTKAALAQAAGVSTRIITAYERGEKEPSSRTLAVLADVLTFPSEFFSGPTWDEPPIDGSSFRALSNLTAQQRDQALGAGAIALALADWIGHRFDLPEPGVPRHRGIEPEAAAMAVRSAWGLGERPIPKIIHLLEAHGVRVFSLAEDCLAMDAFSFWRGSVPFVFLNTKKSAERSRMDAAHELGHLVLHWRGDMRGRESEREADMFGSAFLMPRGSILSLAPRGARLTQIVQAKQRWKVSVGNLTHRMYAVGLLTEWQYRSLFIEMNRRGYRTDEPNGIQAETSQVLGKVFKAMREEGVSVSQVARELAVPVDEISKVIFGLILTPLAGTGTPIVPPTHERPQLHLL